MTVLYLASASPRRYDLLTEAGFQVQALPADCDESVKPLEAAPRYVARLAETKWRAARAQATDPDAQTGWWVAADTTVVANRQILGKPTDFDDACRIWDCLPAPDHAVWTGICVAHGAQYRVLAVSTQVAFRALTLTERRDYWATGEPQDKAGAYALQGVARRFIRGVWGSRSNVIGLPLDETRALLRALHYPGV